MKKYYYKRDGIKTDVDFEELIKFARDWGYESDNCIYTTSESARYLRGLGYEIGENKGGENI